MSAPDCQGLLSWGMQQEFYLSWKECAGNTILNLMCRSLTTREGSCVDTIPLNSLLLRVTNLTPVHHHRLSKCVPHSLLAFHDLIFQTCECHEIVPCSSCVPLVPCPCFGNFSSMKLQTNDIHVPRSPSRWETWWLTVWYFMHASGSK